MPMYEVQLAKTLWATIKVEADDEESAMEAALDDAPRICAQCSGWGDGDASVSDDDDWMPVNEFVDDYSVEKSGPVVKLVEVED